LYAYWYKLTEEFNFGYGNLQALQSTQATTMTVIFYEDIDARVTEATAASTQDEDSLEVMHLLMALPSTDPTKDSNSVDTDAGAVDTPAEDHGQDEACPNTAPFMEGLYGQTLGPR